MTDTEETAKGEAAEIDATWAVFQNAIIAAELTAPERTVLYADVALIRYTEKGTMKEAAELLELRIGGAQNLRSYVDCLITGVEYLTEAKKLEIQGLITTRDELQEKLANLQAAAGILDEAIRFGNPEGTATTMRKVKLAETGQQDNSSFGGSSR